MIVYCDHFQFHALLGNCLRNLKRVLWFWKYVTPMTIVCFYWQNNKLVSHRIWCYKSSSNRYQLNLLVKYRQYALITPPPPPSCCWNPLPLLGLTYAVHDSYLVSTQYQMLQRVSYFQMFAYAILHKCFM
jgi:hypothetical protein